MKIDELHDMDPFQFELFVGQVFSALNYNVILTSRTRDGGIDVIADQYDPNFRQWIRTVIQVKRYKNTIGIEKIRELKGVLSIHNAQFGCLITLSDFKLGVREKTNKEYETISLQNKNEFLELLRNSGMLDAENNVITTTDPNLDKNRKFSILNILSETQPNGTTNVKIIERLRSEFSITVSDKRLEEDIVSLIENGEIISIEEEIFSKPKQSEIQIALNDLPNILKEIDYFINIEIIYQLLEDYYNINHKIWDIYYKKDVSNCLDNLITRGQLIPVDNKLYATNLALDKFRTSTLTPSEMKTNIENILGYDKSTAEKLIRESDFYPPEGICKVVSGTDDESKKLMPFLKIFFARCVHCDGLMVWMMEDIGLYVTCNQIDHKLDINEISSVTERLEVEAKRFQISKLFTERFGQSFEKHFHDLNGTHLEIDGVIANVSIDMEIDEDSSIEVLRDAILKICEPYQSFINEIYAPLEDYGRPLQIYNFEIKGELTISKDTEPRCNIISEKPLNNEH